MGNDAIKRRKVNFFLVGGMKCGSTTLNDYLADHPEIFMSVEKEPGFFVPEIWKNRSKLEYVNLFVDADKEKYIGEGSTFYSKKPTFQRVPERIYEYNNNCKILYIVRKPIDRIVSHYFHHKRNLKLHAEKRTILNAIKQDERYIEYTNYVRQIQPYFNLFGKENVKIVRFEQLISDPDVVLGDIFSWLGVAANHLPCVYKKSNAKPSQSDVVRGFGLLNKFRYSSLWETLSSKCPTILKRIGNTLSAKQENLELSIEEMEQVCRYLCPVSNKIVYDLEKITDDDYSSWII